jgi:hypothetical protein
MIGHSSVGKAQFVSLGPVALKGAICTYVASGNVPNAKGPRADLNSTVTFTYHGENSTAPKGLATDLPIRPVPGCPP